MLLNLKEQKSREEILMNLRRSKKVVLNDKEKRKVSLKGIIRRYKKLNKEKILAREKVIIKEM